MTRLKFVGNVKLSVKESKERKEKERLEEVKSESIRQNSGGILPHRRVRPWGGGIMGKCGTIIATHSIHAIAQGILLKSQTQIVLYVVIFYNFIAIKKISIQ